MNPQTSRNEGESEEQMDPAVTDILQAVKFTGDPDQYTDYMVMRKAIIKHIVVKNKTLAKDVLDNVMVLIREEKNVPPPSRFITLDLHKIRIAAQDKLFKIPEDIVVFNSFTRETKKNMDRLKEILANNVAKLDEDGQDAFVNFFNPLLINNNPKTKPMLKLLEGEKPLDVKKRKVTKVFSYVYQKFVVDFKFNASPRYEIDNKSVFEKIIKEYEEEKEKGTRYDWKTIFMWIFIVVTILVLCYLIYYFYGSPKQTRSDIQDRIIRNKFQI